MIASRIFDMDLQGSAVRRGSDGRFRDGRVVGRRVKIKFYSR